jgi:hypothetical protein
VPDRGMIPQASKNLAAMPFRTMRPGGGGRHNATCLGAEPGSRRLSILEMAGGLIRVIGSVS